MDVFSGLSVDDFLDLPTHDFSSSFHHPSSAAAATATFFEQSSFSYPSFNPTDFSNLFCVPADDAAELEWISNYMDDSITDFRANDIAGAVNFQPKTASGFHGRARSKRSRSSASENPTGDGGSVKKGENIVTRVARRCTHCASEKTPQWRTGPLGPKTLCNACGVRYKSGRLVPEYRPAASPTFVLTQHSNSHRKVLELRRQKELLRQQLLQQQEGYSDVSSFYVSA